MKKVVYKLILRIVILCSTFSLSDAKSQTTIGNTPIQNSFIKLTEMDENRNQILLTDEYKIVEPNSKIQVKFDKDALKKLLSSNTLSKEITDRLSHLKNMLADENNVIEHLDNAIKAYNENKPDSVWQKELQKIGPATITILKDKESRAVYNSLTNDHTLLTQYTNLFKTAEIMIPILQQRMQVEARTNGVYIQLGAWLDVGQASNPIHIVGFDDYSSQPTSSVDRFQVVLTKDQQDQLDAISSLASEANINGLSATIKKAADNVGNGIAMKLKQIPSFIKVNSIVNDLKTMVSEDQQKLGSLKSTVEDAYKELEAYKSDIDTLIKKYTNMPANADAGKLLEQLNTDISQLISETEDFNTKMQGFSKSINDSVNATVPSIRAQLTTLTDSLQSLGVMLTQDSKNLGTQATEFFRQLVLGEDVINQTHDFTDKIKKMSLDALPEEAVIDLKTAGNRDVGNKITIKLATSKAGELPKEQFNKEYFLYFCSIYARTTVGFLFVNPTPLFQRIDQKALFRYAPSYSILLKGFWKSKEASRRNLKYHTFFDPGIGLNFSALDFTGDGTMKLGIGGIFSIFKDILQLGFGFNTFDGTGYAFFGFKLPVRSFILH